VFWNIAYGILPFAEKKRDGFRVSVDVSVEVAYLGLFVSLRGAMCRP